MYHSYCLRRLFSIFYFKARENIHASLMIDVSSSKGVVYENICLESKGIIVLSNFHASSFDDNSKMGEGVVRKIMMTRIWYIETLPVASGDPDIDHEPISGEVHELNYKGKLYVLAYFIGTPERGLMRIEIQVGAKNLPGSMKSECYRLTGQFRGKTEFVSATKF